MIIQPKEHVPADMQASYLVRPLNSYRVAAIEEYAGRSMLDVGCGGGAYVLAYAGRKETSGVDLVYYPSWAAAPERFITTPSAHLPFVDGQFETVTCFEVLEHVPDPMATLLEMRRVSCSNIIITVPNCELPPIMEESNLCFYHWTDRTHINFFTLASLQALVSEAGFSVQHAVLINPANAWHLALHALGLPDGARRLMAKVLRRLCGNQMYGTCLVVASK